MFGMCPHITWCQEQEGRWYVLTLSALKPVQPRQPAQPRHFLLFSSEVMGASLKAGYLLKYITYLPHTLHTYLHLLTLTFIFIWIEDIVLEYQYIQKSHAPWHFFSLPHVLTLKVGDYFLEMCHFQHSCQCWHSPRFSDTFSLRFAGISSSSGS